MRTKSKRQLEMLKCSGGGANANVGPTHTLIIGVCNWLGMSMLRPVTRSCDYINIWKLLAPKYTTLTDSHIFNCAAFLLDPKRTVPLSDLRSDYSSECNMNYNIIWALEYVSYSAYFFTCIYIICIIYYPTRNTMGKKSKKKGGGKKAAPKSFGKWVWVYIFMPTPIFTFCAVCCMRYFYPYTIYVLLLLTPCIVC